MNSIVEDILMHYGMPRRSGRYPYGSGENPYQHKVKCYGYYTMANGVKWLYIQFVLDGVQYTGFSSSAYLAK